jgi:ubiquinone/menaquinone biosynthesis C-methylase UbiE
MNEFDIKAAEWDLNPMHWDRSKAIAVEIIKIVPLNKKMKVLEYGAGTGITSFLLKDYVGEITLMDNSQEMVRITNEKIASTKANNLKTLICDLETEDYEGKFDLIFTQMVMHHVNDTEKIISKFSKLLNSEGHLVIADLYEEDGSFHGEGFTGHNGFNIDKLSDTLKGNNFSDLSHRTCFVIDRKISETGSKKFEVFLLDGKKN